VSKQVNGPRWFLVWRLIQRRVTLCLIGISHQPTKRPAELDVGLQKSSALAANCKRCSAKTAVRIKRPFRIGTHMDPGNIMLNGGSDLSTETVTFPERWGLDLEKFRLLLRHGRPYLSSCWAVVRGSQVRQVSHRSGLWESLKIAAGAEFLQTECSYRPTTSTKALKDQRKTKIIKSY